METIRPNPKNKKEIIAIVAESGNPYLKPSNVANDALAIGLPKVRKRLVPVKGTK